MVTRNVSSKYEWRLLAEHNLAGKPEEELTAVGSLIVADCVKELNLPKARLERLKTAVKEAVTNLFRRGAPGQSPLPLAIRVYITQDGVPAGLQDAEQRPGTLDFVLPSGSGWGFFLVEKVADAANLNGSYERFNGPRPNLEDFRYAIEVFLYREGESG